MNLTNQEACSSEEKDEKLEFWLRLKILNFLKMKSKLQGILTHHLLL